MQIKLVKKAQWDGKQHKSGTTHNVSDEIAEKLISRGYAEEYSPEAIVEEVSADADSAE